MATAAFDGRVEVWQQTGTAPPVKLQSLVGHQGRVRRVAFSPSVRWLASAGSDGTARLWKLGSADACLLRVASQSTVCRTDGAIDCPDVYQVLFAPDERWLLSASSDASQPLRVWDPVDCVALPLPDVFASLPDGVRRLAIASAAEDAVLVATGGGQGSIRLMRRDRQGVWTQACRWDTHLEAITEVTFSPDGRWLAAASRDGRASLYPLAASPTDRLCGQPLLLDGQAGSLYDIQFAPDSKALVTAAFEAKAHVWSLDGTLLAELGGHANRVISAQFSPDGHWLLTASRDGTVRIWKRPLRARTTPLEAYLTLDANLGSATDARFSPDGHAIGVGYWENAALLWRLWSIAPPPDRQLERLWGSDRARLELIREAVRFQDEFRLDRVGAPSALP
jgi:WD40 repeat protein